MNPYVLILAFLGGCGLLVVGMITLGLFVEFLPWSLFVLTYFGWRHRNRPLQPESYCGIMGAVRRTMPSHGRRQI